MKKVFFLINSMDGGGAEKAIKIIVENLDQERFQPTLVLIEKNVVYDLPKNIEVVFLTHQKVARLALAGAMVNFIFQLWRNKPDIIVSTLEKSHYLNILSRPFYNKAIRVINEQVDTLTHYKGNSRKINLLKRFVAAGDYQLFISRGIVESWKKVISFKREPTVISNPIDFDEIDQKKIIELPQEYYPVFQKPVIITAGRLAEQKAQHVMLDAFAKVTHDTHLVILGMGPLEESLKQQCYKLGIEKRVFFLGFQKNPFQFFAKSDLFVLSSAWEGFGNVIPEAMRCNLPVVSTNAPSGPSEILGDDAFGFLVNVGDSDALAEKINLLLSDRALYEKYKALAYQRSEEFSKVNIVQKYEAFFGTVVKT